MSVSEDSQALPPTRFPEGYISYSRAIAAVELFFGDLPKALAVTKMELEKIAIMDQGAEQDARAVLAQQVKEGVYMTSQTFTEGIAAAALCVLADSLYEILLEGWRMSSLLLGQSIPSFSWRRTMLAFIQADVCHRGWLDPHEVSQAETRRLQVAQHAPQLPIADRTSLGAFVLRCVRRCGDIPQANVPQAPTDAPGAGRPKGTLERQRLEKKKAAEVSLQVVGAAFESMKKSVEVYLTWLMHSQELRDLAVYRTVKSQIFSFQEASGNGSATSSAHHLRSLLLLLLAHQFDVQFQQEDVGPEQLDWDLRCLLQLLRESWRRGANSEAGPEFGIELETIGGTSAMA